MSEPVVQKMTIELIGSKALARAGDVGKFGDKANRAERQHTQAALRGPSRRADRSITPVGGCLPAAGRLKDYARLSHNTRHRYETADF